MRHPVGHAQFGQFSVTVCVRDKAFSELKKLYPSVNIRRRIISLQIGCDK